MTKVSISHPILQQLSNIAERHRKEIYLVGGYVRDLLLGNPSHDIDITIEGSGLEFAELVARELRVKPIIFERFGTAMLMVGETQIEFVGTRKEEYLPDSRKPIVTEGTLLDDLRRRDFTVNAMAIRVNGSSTGEIIDHFDGLGDLERKLLRTPLDPVITYSDDPLRMMRAARFAAQLQFELDPDSYDAISQMRERISIVSQERITAEFLKLLQSSQPSIGLAILLKTGLLELVFPEVHRLEGVDLMNVGGIRYAHKNVFWHTLKVVDNAAAVSDNLYLRFAALMHDVAKPKTKKFREGIGWSFHGHEEIGARWQERIFRRMKLPMKQKEYVEKLVRLHHRPMALVDDGVTDSAIRRLIVDAGEDLDDLFILCRADITSKDPQRVKKYLKNYDGVIERIQEVREKDRLRAFQSPVRGEQIMELCGLGPSKMVGILKTAIEDAILEGRIPNEYDAALAYLLEIKDEMMEVGKEVGSRK